MHPWNETHLLTCLRRHQNVIRTRSQKRESSKQFTSLAEQDAAEMMEFRRTCCILCSVWQTADASERKLPSIGLSWTHDKASANQGLPHSGPFRRGCSIAHMRLPVETASENFFGHHLTEQQKHGTFAVHLANRMPLLCFRSEELPVRVLASS